MQQFEDSEVLVLITNIEKITDEVRFFLVSNPEIDQMAKISELDELYLKKGQEIDKLSSYLNSIKAENIEINDTVKEQINNLAVEDKHLLTMLEERRDGVKLKLKNLMAKKKLLLYNKTNKRILWQSEQ